MERIIKILFMILMVAAAIFVTLLLIAIIYGRLA